MKISKPTSFPYLDIAKRHGLDYGYVLEMADIGTHGRWPEQGTKKRPEEPIMSEILGAVTRFKLIQQGAIKPF